MSISKGAAHDAFSKMRNKRAESETVKAEQETENKVNAAAAADHAESVPATKNTEKEDNQKGTDQGKGTELNVSMEAAKEKLNMTEDDIINVIMQSKKILDNIPEQDAKKVGRPTERKETFKLSLYLDKDLRKYIKYTAMKQYKAVTMYINDLIRAEMEKEIANGADPEDWNRLPD